MMSITLYTLCFLAIYQISFSSCLLLFKNRFEKVYEKINQRLPSDLVSVLTNEKLVQKVDHFSPTDVRTWNQFYYCEKSYYKKGAPIYLWIESEAPANPLWMYFGYWIKHGRQNNASFFLIEHRYYGMSQPLGNTSTENLRYLTTSQALSDLASFIVSMNTKHNFPKNTKWILFGRSYAGNLAAWMRMKYPHLVHAAVASSAPVLAQFDFPEYFDVVADSLAAYSNQCRDDIALANQELDKMVRTAVGRKQIGNIFKLCSPLQGRRLDIVYFLSNMEEFISGSVQNDNWGKNIKRVCDEMLENAEEISPVKRYAKLMDMFLKRYEEKCLVTNFTRYIESVKKVDVVSAISTYRAWIYQTCTEYGYYVTSRKKGNIFSSFITLDIYLNMCMKIFDRSHRPFLSNRIVLAPASASMNTFAVVLTGHRRVQEYEYLMLLLTSVGKSKNELCSIYTRGKLADYLYDTTRYDVRCHDAILTSITRNHGVNVINDAFASDADFDESFIRQSVNNTNTFFGDLKINISRILFVHGSVDPWHALGIVSVPKNQKNINVIYLKGGSHCWDLRLPGQREPKEAVVAKKQITNLIDSWLRE